MIRGYIYANDGSKIEAFKNLSGDKGWDTDCHGTTFADGKLWVNNGEVSKILKGDKYKSVKEGEERVGDVVIYTNDEERPNSDNVEDSKTVTKTNTGEGTCVYGQGGLEVKNKEDQVNQAWCNDAGTTQKNFFRKTQSDVKVSCEQAQTMRNNELQNFINAAAAAGATITYH